MYPVYVITCTHPDYERPMRYVGVILTDGKTIQDRFKHHLSSDTMSGAPYLRAAIRKHGREYFYVRQIGSGNTPEQAKEMERLFIAELNTKRPNGFNLTDGGDGVRLTGDKHPMFGRKGKDNPLYGRPSPLKGRPNLKNRGLVKSQAQRQAVGKATSVRWAHRRQEIRDYVKEHPSMSISEISRQLKRDRASVSRAIQEVEQCSNA